MARMELVVVALGLLLDLCQGFGVPLARGAAWAPSRGALAIRPSRGIGAGSRSSSPSQRLQTAAHAGGGGGSSTWWEERGELPFECTGCGKCCRVQGDVWVDPEEASSLAEHLSLSLDDFVKQYTSRSAQGWVQLLDRGEDHACIFLGEAVAPPPGDAEGGGGSGGEEVLGAGYVSGRRGDGGDVSEEERSIVGLVSDWAERHVIRLGLCPFAKPAMETGKVRFKIASGLVDVDSACRLLLQEADLVMQTSEEVLPTTLIAFPDLFPDNFLEWNTFVESIEDNLDQGGGWEEVGEHVLIAAFHPGFEFGGLEEAERVLNFEKRAPVPVINLLRTEAIDRGIERGVTAEKIAEDNEEALLNEGLEDVKRVYEDLGDKEA